MKYSGALLVGVLALGASSAARQGRSTDGRWTLLGLPISYVFSGDSVAMVMYPPQAPLMTYRVRGDSIETEASGSRRAQAFSIRGDTLRLVSGMSVAVYRRVSSLTASKPGLTGTWHSTDGRGGSVLTFRSDGQLVPEVEAPTQMHLHGDTLDVTAGGQALQMVLQRMGDTISLSPLAGVALPAGSQPQRIVRRPWSCFGMTDIDRSAAECR